MFSQYIHYQNRNTTYGPSIYQKISIEPTSFSMWENVVLNVRPGYLVTSSICFQWSFDRLAEVILIKTRNFLLIFLISPQ